MIWGKRVGKSQLKTTLLFFATVSKLLFKLLFRACVQCKYPKYAKHKWFIATFFLRQCLDFMPLSLGDLRRLKRKGWRWSPVEVCRVTVSSWRSLYTGLLLHCCLPLWAERSCAQRQGARCVHRTVWPTTPNNVRMRMYGKQKEVTRNIFTSEQYTLRMETCVF